MPLSNTVDVVLDVTAVAVVVRISPPSTGIEASTFNCSSASNHVAGGVGGGCDDEEEDDEGDDGNAYLSARCRRSSGGSEWCLSASSMTSSVE